MISYFGVKNFKSLHNVGLKTTNLNLLMGLNSMGKSSLIQSLLMLRQSFLQGSWEVDPVSKKSFPLKNLLIHGDLISLGTAKDIFCQNASLSEINFSLIHDKSKIELSYLYDSKVSQEKKLIGGLKYDTLDCVADIPDINLFGDGFHYLAAEHLGPQKIYEGQGQGLSKLNVLGNRGEWAPFYLAKNGTSVLQNEKLHHERSKSKVLSHELDAWLGEISPGSRLVAEQLVDLDMVKMSFQFENGLDYTDKYLPINVGFGLPYVVPLLLNILISKPGDLLLIENPESHLHPRGQSQLGLLLALAAESGVQIFCETHSDHVVNGVRVAIKEKKVSSEKSCLYYFEKDDDMDSMVIPISIDSKGELESYPVGLLDEWGDMMARLI